MKPRARPGKIVTDGRSARANLAGAKPLSANQMDHLKQEKPVNRMSPKAGKGGRRVKQNLDYAEARSYAKKGMPGKDNEAISQDGIHRVPKNSR